MLSHLITISKRPTSSMSSYRAHVLNPMKLGSYSIMQVWNPQKCLIFKEFNLYMWRWFWKKKSLYSIFEAIVFIYIREKILFPVPNRHVRVTFQFQPTENVGSVFAQTGLDPPPPPPPLTYISLMLLAPSNAPCSISSSLFLLRSRDSRLGILTITGAGYSRTFLCLTKLLT